MDVTEIPFNKFIGLKLSDDPGYLMVLEAREEYTNHLGTVHASAMFALAEATSGLFLLSELQELEGNGYAPVVRKVGTKYRKPAKGRIFSDARFPDTDRESVISVLREKGRVLCDVEVALSDESGNAVMISTFEWFITKL